MKGLTTLDKWIYYIWCVLTLGTPFFIKIIIKKACAEMKCECHK